MKPPCRPTGRPAGPVWSPLATRSRKQRERERAGSAQGSTVPTWADGNALLWKCTCKFRFIMLHTLVEPSERLEFLPERRACVSEERPPPSLTPSTSEARRGDGGRAGGHASSLLLWEVREAKHRNQDRGSDMRLQVRNYLSDLSSPV